MMNMMMIIIIMIVIKLFRIEQMTRQLHSLISRAGASVLLHLYEIWWHWSCGLRADTIYNLHTADSFRQLLDSLSLYIFAAVIKLQGEGKTKDFIHSNHSLKERSDFVFCQPRTDCHGRINC